MRSLATCLLLLPGLSAQTHACPPDLEPVRKHVLDAVKNGKAPSCAIVVVRDDKIVWAEGFGSANLGKGRNGLAGPDTAYRIASISKPITATVILLLAQRGLLDLDRPVNAYLEGSMIVNHCGKAEEITARRLLDHSSGLPTHYTFYYDDIAPPSVEATVAAYGFAATAPGKHFEYSNLGYGILGHLAGLVTKSSWEALVEDEVFKPVGMKHSIAKQRMEEVATPYKQDVGGAFLTVGHYRSDHPGASAVCSSALDLARFLRLHLGLGVLDGKRLLDSRTALAMQTLSIGREPSRSGPSEDRGYGLGWFVERWKGARCFWHSGGMPGVSCMLRGFPEQHCGFVVLTNTDDRTLTEETSTLLGDALLKVADSRASSPPASAPSHGPVVDCLGSWRGRMLLPTGEAALRLECSESQVTLWTGGGDGTKREARNVTRRASLGFSVDAPLVAVAGWHGLPRLEFTLRREGERLVGVCVAKAEGYFALSHWVELERVKP